MTELKVISNEYCTPDNVVNDDPFIFYINKIPFKIDQFSVYDMEIYEKLIYTDFKFLVYPDIQDDDINKILSDLLINDLPHRSKRLSLILCFIAKFLKPMNRTAFWLDIVLCFFKNINRFNFYNPLNGYLLQHLSFNQLFELILRLYSYNNFIKKKIISVLQKGIGNTCLESMTGLAKIDSFERPFSLGVAHDELLKMLTSKAS